MANEQHRGWVRVLQEAQFDGVPVLVTETESESGTEIVDIRRVENPPSPALLKVAGIAPAAHPAATRPVTSEEAMKLFNMVAKRSCDPLEPSDTCIPFLYPRDGCHARAHEMCRLMIEAGAQPAKVWNFSNGLVVKTPNEPTCKATWGIHVAPTLQVRLSEDAEAETQVIDPSLFAGPVSVTTWQNAQGDPESVLAYTSFHPFLPPMAGDVDTDPTYEETQQALILYRSKLKLRAHRTGRPPYHRCTE
jgi:Glutaminase